MKETTGRCPSTAVVHNCCDMLKQPLMRAVTQEEHIAALLLTKSQVTPPLGYDGAYPNFSDGSEDK